MKKIIEILSEAGYDVTDLSNRQKSIQQINKVLSYEGINIDVCKNGKVWVTKIGKKFTIKVSGFGWSSTMYSKHISANDILKCVGDFLKIEDVRNGIKLNLDTPYTCNKCEGKGHIPSFSWYANGVCFDCMGSGIVGNYKLSTIANEPKRIDVSNIADKSELFMIIFRNDKENFVEGVRQEAFHKAVSLGYIEVVNERHSFISNEDGTVFDFDCAYKWTGKLRTNDKWYSNTLNKYFIGIV